MHYVVSLRIWTLYGRSKSIGFLLWGSFVLYLASTLAIGIKAIAVIPFELVPVINICLGTLPDYLWAVWLPSTVYETLVFLLTLFKAIQYHFNGVETPLLYTLYRDGFLYYAFIVFSSVCNLIFLAVESQSKVVLIKYISTAATLAAGSHLIIHLREVGRVRPTEVATESTFRLVPVSQSHGRAGGREPSTAHVFVGKKLRPISFTPGGRSSLEPSPLTPRSQMFSPPFERERIRPKSADSWTPPTDWGVVPSPRNDHFDNFLQDLEEEETEEGSLSRREKSRSQTPSRGLGKDHHHHFSPFGSTSSTGHSYPPEPRPKPHILQVDIPSHSFPGAIGSLGSHPYAQSPPSPSPPSSARSDPRNKSYLDLNP